MTIDIRPGDCLELMKTIPDRSVDMILCDLPYGTTACSWDVIIPFDRLWDQYKRITKPNSAIVLFAQTPFDKVLGASNIGMLKYEWIWDKKQGTGHLNSHKAPLKNHENILVFYEKLPTYNPQMRKGFKPYVTKRVNLNSDNYGKQTDCITESDGSRFPLSIIQFDRDTTKVHPTQKPESIMRYLIETYSNEGDIVMDNTMGSGTTGVACVQTNRSFIGFEKELPYFNIATDRIESAVKITKENLSMFDMFKEQVSI